jgi:hypothetical protein
MKMITASVEILFCKEQLLIILISRLEYFPSQLDQILVGAFYKIIDDPIESALQISGQAIFLQPNNFGTANNMGVEVDVQSISEVLV